MTEAVLTTEAARERPAWRISFRWLVTAALGLAVIAFVAGRHIYDSYGGYRPLALMHVPQTMGYRARVELNDPKRAPALAPLLRAADPRGVRLPALQKKLGGASLREVAFGTGAWGPVGPDAEKARAAPQADASEDFVVVLGLQLQAETGLPPPAQSLCEVLRDDGIRSKPTASGCLLDDGTLIASADEGAVVIASKAELVKDLLERPELGDRMGFSGPSVRGTAPEPVELTREAEALGRRLAAKYP